MNNIDKENARKIGDMLNSFSFHPNTVCEYIARTEHRTVQQTLTRFCIAWLSTCASDDYRYDERNKASHEVAKALLDSQDADTIGNLPFI